MCVSRSCQRQGVGSKLLSELNSVLAAKLVKNMYLATDINMPSAKFYNTNGFSQEEKMGFYYKQI